MIRRPPRSTPFPYTTLSRSEQRSHELLFERAPSDDRGQLRLDQAHVLGEHLAEVRREGLCTAGRPPAAGEGLDPLLGRARQSEIGSAHSWTSVTVKFRMPSS